MTWRQPRPKRGAPWPLSPHGVKHALLSLGSGPVAASVRTALAVTCHRYRTGGSSSHTGQFLQLSWFWHMPSTPPPIVGVYEYGKKCGNGWHSTTAVREQRADLLATQVTLHRALLCIEQPLSSTVSLHHPARPHSPLCLTRLNAPWMAAECRNLRAVCKNGNFLLMVAHLAPKHFSQGEALGCISFTKLEPVQWGTLETNTTESEHVWWRSKSGISPLWTKDNTCLQIRHPLILSHFWGYFEHVLPAAFDLSAFCPLPSINN